VLLLLAASASARAQRSYRHLFVSTAHTEEDIDVTLEAAREALAAIDDS